MNESEGPSTSDAPLPQIPDFELIRPIGEGGFGRVWLAVNRTTGRPRAVKLVPLARSARHDPAGREVTSLVRLEDHVRCRHENLLSIHHVSQTAEHLFYVMDLADDISGRPGAADDDYRPATLETRLAAGPLGPGECEDFARQLLAALACLHRSGVVHRDVKPSNCLFHDGRLKLADFGLVTEADLASSPVGTLRYMPPDGNMDTRGDVYAAGLVIYEMLSGLPASCFPALGQRAREVAGSRTLAQLNRLVLRACEPDPAARFRDAAEMLAAIDSTAPPTAARVLRRVRRAGAIAAIAAVVLAAVLWAGRPRVRDADPASLDVNFITEPFEATIEIDGQTLLTAEGTPYRTPCTVSGLAVGPHRVVFKREDRPALDCGVVDLRENEEVVARWPEAGPGPEPASNSPFGGEE